MSSELIECSANDYASLSSRHVAADGTVTAPGVMARTGIQMYRAYELGLDSALGMDPLKLLRIYRSPEEVFAPDSLSTFQGVPVTVGHPPGNVVHAQNVKAVKVGDVRDVSRAGQEMTGNLTILPGRGTQALKAGFNQLSNGYRFSLDMTAGVADGEPFDGQQRNIRGNHLALVKAARCGAACSVADSDPSSLEGELTMAGTQRIVVDGMPVDTDEIAAAAIGKLIQARDAALLDLKTLRETPATSITLKVGDRSITYTGEELIKQIGDKDAQIAELKTNVFTPEQRDALVADWAATLDSAKALAPKVETKGKTCLQVRRDVLTAVSADSTTKGIVAAVLAGKAIGDAEPEAVRAAFNAVAAAKVSAPNTARTAADAATAAALAGVKGQRQAGDAASAPRGRAAFITNSQSAYAK